MEHEVQPENWNEKIREYRENIVKEEQEKTEKMETENKIEESWELYDLCKQFLEENSKDWEKRKVERELEKARLLRIERARIKTKNAKLNQLRKNVLIGEQKLPENEREKINSDEKKNRRLDLQQTKRDLWKLRKKEKKPEITPTLQEIRTLAKKAEKIVEILEIEKKKIEEEKRKAEREKEIKKTRAQQKEKRLEKQRLLTERWALYRWVTEYIDENTERWEKEKIIRKESEEKRIAEWDKRNRFEKIRELKRKLGEKKITKPPENKEHQNTNKARKETVYWTEWRPAAPEPPPRTKENTVSSNLDQLETTNPVKSEDLVNNSRPTTQNYASQYEPKSTMAEYVVKTIMDSVLENIVVHQTSTTKSMEPVPSSPPVQERHTTQNPATQTSSTPRKPSNEQAQQYTSPVQKNVQVKSKSTPTTSKEKPILKTAILNLKP